VPGITTEKDNLLAIRTFLEECGATEIGLLSYNPLWLSKLSGIGASAAYRHAQWMSKEEKDAVRDVFAGFDICGL
jgi:hypothetical protein